jgi:hypothetical protein
MERNGTKIVKGKGFKDPRSREQQLEMRRPKGTKCGRGRPRWRGQLEAAVGGKLVVAVADLPQPGCRARATHRTCV